MDLKVSGKPKPTMNRVASLTFNPKRRMSLLSMNSIDPSQKMHLSGLRRYDVVQTPGVISCSVLATSAGMSDRVKHSLIRPDTELITPESQ